MLTNRLIKLMFYLLQHVDQCDRFIDRTEMTPRSHESTLHVCVVSSTSGCRMLPYIRRPDHATAGFYRPLCDEIRALSNFVLNEQAKAVIAPSRLPAPAIGSLPFSAEVGVGPDSALRVLEALYLLVFAFVSSLVNASCLSPCRFFNRHRSFTFEEIYLGTNSDTSSSATNAQPPPEGEVKDSILSLDAAGCTKTCSDASKQAQTVRHGRSRHRHTLTMAHHLDLTRKSIRTVVSNEASKIAIYP
jgi:hypothetical protein